MENIVRNKSFMPSIGGFENMTRKISLGSGVSKRILDEQAAQRKRLLEKQKRERQSMKSYRKRGARAEYNRSRTAARQQREYEELVQKQNIENELRRHGVTAGRLPSVDWQNLPAFVRGWSRSPASFLYRNQEYLWYGDVELRDLFENGVNGSDHTLRDFFNIVTPWVTPNLIYDPDDKGEHVIYNKARYMAAKSRGLI